MVTGSVRASHGVFTPFMEKTDDYPVNHRSEGGSGACKRADCHSGTDPPVHRLMTTET